MGRKQKPREKKKSGRSVGRPPTHEGELALWINKAGLTRADVATKLDVDRKYLDHICREARRPSLELAVAIERFTGGEVTVAYLASLPKTLR